MSSTGLRSWRVRAGFAQAAIGLSALGILAGWLWSVWMDQRLAAENVIIGRNLTGDGPGKRVLHERLNAMRKEARGASQAVGKPDYLYSTMTTWMVNATPVRFPYHFLGRHTTLHSIEFYAVLPQFAAPSAQTYFGVKRKFGEGWRDVISITLREASSLAARGPESSAISVGAHAREHPGLRALIGDRYESSSLRTPLGEPIRISCDESWSNGNVSMRCLSINALSAKMLVETRFDATHLGQWQAILEQSHALAATFVKNGTESS